jgi:uncharacterized membrane protein
MAVSEVDRPEGERHRLPASLRRFVGHLLRGGVLLSAALMVGGLADGYATGRSVGLPTRLTGGTLVRLLSAGGPEALLLAGLLVLVLTPVARVVISFLEFLSVGDRAFAAITAIVLALLAGTAIVGVLA